MAVVNGVTLLAKRFAIGGVEDKRKKFLDLPRMVGLFSRIAATFANAMRRFKDGAGPHLEAGVIMDKTTECFNIRTFPVRMVLANKVSTHPCTLTGT